MLLQGVQVKLEQADEFNDISNFFTFTVQENITLIVIGNFSIFILYTL